MDAAQLGMLLENLTIDFRGFRPFSLRFKGFRLQFLRLIGTRGDDGEFLRGALRDFQEHLGGQVQHFRIFRELTFQIEQGIRRGLVFPAMQSTTNRGHQGAVSSFLCGHSRRVLGQHRKGLFTAALRGKLDGVINGAGRTGGRRTCRRLRCCGNYK